MFALWASLYRGPLASARLVDPAHFDFRPGVDSPLRRAGVVHPPQAPATPDGHPPDIGAYQYGAEGAAFWQPGCTFMPQCAGPASVPL